MASSDDDEPSPKKALPDFATRKCDSDSVASGDLSDGWDAEEERVMDALAAQMAANATLDAAVLNETINETHEWLNFLDDRPLNTVVSVEDGNDGREPNTPPDDEFETIRININERKTTAKVLAEIAVFFGLPPTGSRKKLFESFVILSMLSNWMTTYLNIVKEAPNMDRSYPRTGAADSGNQHGNGCTGRILWPNE